VPESESDVVLSDGGTVHIRPIRPADADELVRFHDSLSARTVYFRFFTPYPHLTARDVARFSQVDGVDRVALIATLAGRMIGVGRYDVVSPGTAEVAFTVHDDHQGRGLGSVLLEHLAENARKTGLRRFEAEVLPDNRRMLATFAEAGYRPAHNISDGVVSLLFEIQPTSSSISVRTAREHRSEAASIRRLLSPRSVVIVGAGRRSDGVGAHLVRHVLEGGFTGKVYAVNPNVPASGTIGGVPAFASLLEVPAPVDLVVVATPAEAALAVVSAAGLAGAVGVVVVSAGFAESGEEGRVRQRALVRQTRGAGMRLVGPNALGLLNTDPAVSLNASVAPRLPERGRVGFFCQSGALGGAILDRAERRGIGASTFVSAGNRADVSGNDLMQFWEDDPATDLVLLYLESIGNPRKFTRIARRLARSKPIVAVRSGRSTQSLPLGHRVRRTLLPPAAVDALFEQSGVIQTNTLAEWLDVAVILTNQPLPAGNRVAAVGNSDALGVLAQDALVAEGLVCADASVSLRGDADVPAFYGALIAAVQDPAVDAVLAVYVPVIEAEPEPYIDALVRAAQQSAKPVIAVLVVPGGEDVQIGPAGSPVPLFGTVEDAVHALAKVWSYAQWRSVPETGVPELPDVDPAAAAKILELVLQRVPEREDPAQELLHAYRPTDELGSVLGAYGIEVLPATPVSTIGAAVKAARIAGFPVALSAVRPLNVRRADRAGVRLDLSNERAVRTAWAALESEVGPDQMRSMRIQAMAPRGVECRIASVEDPLFGPVVSLTAGGAVAQLMGDRTYRIPPLTEADAHAMVGSPRVAPLLDGVVGPTGRAALEDLLVRVGRIAEDSPTLAHLVLEPVLVSAGSLVVLGATARVRHPTARTDRDARRLR
jgi:acyl-CoA synthetase (NDP forming)/GNAT superfamily N-acetyltransferase